MADANRLNPILGLEDDIAVAHQHLARECAHRRIVLDEDDGLLPLRRRHGLDEWRLVGGRSIARRQIDLKRRAGTRLTLDLDVPIELLDDAVDGREAHPRALAWLLRREEGLEDVID